VPTRVDRDIGGTDPGTNRRMRVLQYRRRLLAYGGIEKYVDRVSLAMCDQGIDVTVAASSIAKGLRLDPRVHQVEVRERRTPIGAIVPGVVPLLSRTRPTVVHVHSLSSLSGLLHFSGPWTRVLSPYFHHDIVDSQLADFLRKRYRIAARWAQSMVFMSAEELALFEDFTGCKPRRWAIIPPGVDGATDATDAPARSGITVIARLEPYKRVDVVIEAAAAAGRLDALTIVGEGADGARLAGLVARLGGNPTAVLVGALDDRQLDQLLSRTSVVVSMSESESYGMTLAEGIAAGTAVVASDIPAHRQVLALVPTDHYELIGDDLRSLARALEAPPAAPPAGRYMRNWESVGAELVAHYEAVARRDRR
jgi:glycosyltransferase involved in cell wall biosynthesis